MTDTLVERVLTINDYQRAIDTLHKVRAKAKAGKKLSRKDQAILVYAADSVAAHRSSDAMRDAIDWRSTVVEEVPATPPLRSLPERIRLFRRMLVSGMTAAGNSLLIGEEAYATSIKSDFERIFAPELEE
ncbi:hypothetical protein AU099_gp04 [Gordonia phage GTE8]|uniref:Uncharacterized protein n=1 Tax=Gordonia phage GTE8 TaxID=1647475 RepID=A0A0K0N6H8_9CAUD|nr:hypothetical protein AU099_gp04 [Gordonia phage GTE8]AKJ72347.1 hypothetical protein GTE8_4 [Gordonia phage GTE8]